MRYFIVVFPQYDIYKYRNCSMAFRFPHVCCQLLAELHICVPQRSLIILYIILPPDTDAAAVVLWILFDYASSPAFRRAKNYISCSFKKKKLPTDNNV